MDRPRLVVTVGDPRGIGPEVAAKALALCAAAAPRSATGPAEFAALVVGPAEHRGGFPAWCRYEAVGNGATGLAPGRVAGLAVERAVELAMAGGTDAVVTAPVHKPAMAEAGFPAGHTEMLAALSGASQVGMLMCDEGVGAPGTVVRTAETSPRRCPKRVLLATIHVPLADVPKLVTAELLVAQTQLLAAALRSDWGIATPRIALCALNPHASDDGMFGAEECTAYGPALSALARESWPTRGPLPADTVFSRQFSGEFDAVVAPYHDVGMAAFKTACFGRGVNVTIGLPFVRTSPDHGTAFDIAGRDAADPSSMTEAVRLAVRLAHQRRGAP